MLVKSAPVGGPEGGWLGNQRRPSVTMNTTPASTSAMPTGV